jgi:hypothetical protein
MSEIASASINRFGIEPKADFVPPSEDAAVLEIPLSEFQHLLNDAVGLFNDVAEIVRDSGILRGKDLAKLTTRATESIRGTKSPLEKVHLVFAYIRQLMSRIKDHLKSGPQKEGLVRTAITKIQLRAQAIVEHIKVLAEGKEKIALDSSHARQYLAGMEGKPVSRRDCIRALRRVEKICPALTCDHIPNDGRQTMRLTGKLEDLNRTTWQQSAPRIGYSG